MHKAGHKLTDEERAERQRQRKITSMAREIQHRLDRDALYAKLPEVVTAMIGASDEDEADDMTVEYTETYNRKLVPIASLVVRTGVTYFQEDQLKVLMGIARALGMTGTVQASRDVDGWNGNRELEYVLRPASSKIGKPSEEAMSEATMRLVAEEAASAT